MLFMDGLKVSCAECELPGFVLSPVALSGLENVGVRYHGFRGLSSLQSVVRGGFRYPESSCRWMFN